VERRKGRHRAKATRVRDFVKLLRLRRSSGKRVPLPYPPCPFGGPLRTRDLGPTRESLPHFLTIVGR
jgi:hypothetical protein